MATGDLVIVPFDHQHPFPPDKRFQVDNLNRLNTISTYIRWEGMMVYVVAEQKTFQLVGGIGNENWVELGFGAGGVTSAVLYTPQALTVAQQQQARINIGASPLQDGLISLGAVTTSGNDVTIASASVRINGINYGTIDPVTISVPPPSSGTTRRDIIVMNTDAEIVLVQGAETTGTAVTPDIPANTVLLVETFSTDAGLDSALEAALTNYVRFDINTQGLTSTQKRNANTNIGSVKNFEADTRTGTLTNNGQVIVNAAGGVAINTGEDGSAAGTAFEVKNTRGGGVEIERRGSTTIIAEGDSTTDYHILRLQETSEDPPVFEVRAGGVAKGADAINDDDLATLGQVRDEINTGFTTNLATDKFYTETIGTGPSAISVVHTKTPKDEILIEDGAQVIYPSEMKNFIFTGKGVVLEGVGYADEENEFTVENRTGESMSIITGGGIANTEFAQAFTMANGEKLAFKGNGTTWDNVEVNDIATSDAINSSNAITTIDENGLESISNIQDVFTKEDVNFKEVLEVPTLVDGIINIEKNGKYYKRVLKEYNLGEFNVLPENTSAENATNFAFAQTVIPADSRVILPTGIYRMDDVEITKSGLYDFSGVTIINDLEVTGNAITINQSVDYCEIYGLNIKYEGIFYTTSVGWAGTDGVVKYGITAHNKKTILTNCRASGFSQNGFYATITSEAFYLITCTSVNNGYAGVFSQGTDFQVFGGEYSENGGSNGAGNGYGDGYGIIGNIATRGNFKVIGTTSNWNRTRNIDSHNGHEIIIVGNYTEDAGQAHPQWFNQSFDAAHSIRMTQLIQKCVIANNISKRSMLAGIAIDSDLSASEYIRDCIITGNILEDNRYQIYIRQNQTEKLIISNNVATVTGDVVLNADQSDLVINPQTDTLNLGWIKDLNICNNSFDSKIGITAAGIGETTKIKLLNNSFTSCTGTLGAVQTEMVVSGNFHESLQVSGSHVDNILVYHNNIQDKNDTTIGFGVHSSYTGTIEYTDNFLLNSNAATLILLAENQKFSRNKILRCNKSGSVVTAIRSVTSNVTIEDNYISCVIAPTYSLRSTLAEKVKIKDNVTENGTLRLEYTRISDGISTGINSDKIIVDSVDGYYDFGLNTYNDVNFTFQTGDVAIVRSPTTGSNREFVYSGGAWVPYNYSKKPDGIISASSYNLLSTDVNKYLRFTGTAGNINILSDTFLAGDEIIGEIEGGAKTVLPGAGVTLRYPVGGTNVIPANGSFRLKFKTANNVLLEYDDIGATSYLGLSDTTDTTFTNKAFFVPSVSAFESGITLENPAIFRPVFTINDTTGSAWTASAIGDAVQLIRIVDAGGGTLAGATGMEFKKLTIMNESASTFTLLHEDTGTTATNRFNFADSNDLVLPVNGWVDLMYVNGRYRRGL